MTQATATIFHTELVTLMMGYHLKTELNVWIISAAIFMMDIKPLYSEASSIYICMYVASLCWIRIHSHCLVYHVSLSVKCNSTGCRCHKKARQWCSLGYEFQNDGCLLFVISTQRLFLWAEGRPATA